MQHFLLSRTAGSRQGGRPSILVDCPAEHSQGCLLLVLLVLLLCRPRLCQQESLDGLGSGVPIGGGIKRLASAVHGQHPSPVDVLERLPGDQSVRTARKSVRAAPAISPPQVVVSQVEADEGRRTGRIHRDRGPSESERERDSSRRDAQSRSGHGVDLGKLPPGKAQAQGVLHGDDAHVDRHFPLPQGIRIRIGGDAFIRHLQQQSLLHVCHHALQVAHPEDVVIKVLDALEEAPVDGLARESIVTLEDSVREPAERSL